MPFSNSFCSFRAAKKTRSRMLYCDASPEVGTVRGASTSINDGRLVGLWKETASGAKNDRSERKRVLAMAQASKIDPPARVHEARMKSTAVEHPWPRRIIRSIQFAFERIRTRDGYIEARAVPFDLRFRGPSADCITRHIYRLGAHEPHISRYVIQHIRLAPGDIAIDVGANLGWYTVLLSRLSEPGARIFAFEPDPETYRLLCENLRANSACGVTALNLALGETPGTAMLHRYKTSNNGRHTLSAGSDGGGGQCEVSVQTLDSFCASRGLGATRVRLLKIDVEGFEYYVVRGATSLLQRCDCILLEFNRGETANKLLQLLAQIGLTARVFVDGNPEPMTFSEILQSPVQLDLLLTPVRPQG